MSSVYHTKHSFAQVKFGERTKCMSLLKSIYIKEHNKLIDSDSISEQSRQIGIL